MLTAMGRLEPAEFPDTFPELPSWFDPHDPTGWKLMCTCGHRAWNHSTDAPHCCLTCLRKGDQCPHFRYPITHEAVETAQRELAELEEELGADG